MKAFGSLGSTFLILVIRCLSSAKIKNEVVAVGYMLILLPQ